MPFSWIGSNVQQEKPLSMHCNTSKCMKQEFEPKLLRDILKMSWNKSIDVRARFGAIYSASKTKKYLLKNSTIGNQLLFSELANIDILYACPENSNWWLLLPDSNIFLKFHNFHSYGLLLQRFFWNFSGIFITSKKADTTNFSKKYQQNFF